MKRERISKSDLKEMEEEINDEFRLAKLSIYRDQIASREKELKSLETVMEANLEAKEKANFEETLKQFRILANEFQELSKKTIKIVEEFIENGESFYKENSKTLKVLPKTLDIKCAKVKTEVELIERTSKLLVASAHIIGRCSQIIVKATQTLYVRNGPKRLKLN